MLTLMSRFSQNSQGIIRSAPGMIGPYHFCVLCIFPGFGFLSPPSQLYTIISFLGKGGTHTFLSVNGHGYDRGNQGRRFSHQLTSFMSIS